MILQTLPVLITSGDLAVGGGELNGRRWAANNCWVLGASGWKETNGLGT